MNKKSLGFCILKWSLIGQAIVIIATVLCIVFNDNPVKETVSFVIGAAIAYWSIFGTLAYQTRNWVRVEKED